MTPEAGGLLDTLIRMLLVDHPIPWTIEYDWCVEVYDANHGLVIKLKSDRDARELVSIAELLATEYAQASVEIERILNEPEI